MLFVSNPDGVDATLRCQSLDALRDLNTMRRTAVGVHGKIVSKLIA